MKRLIADRGYDANSLRATLREHGTIPVIRAGAIASGPFSTTSAATRTAGASRPCSAASKTSAASPRATISLPATTSLPLLLPLPSPSGSERVWTPGTLLRHAGRPPWQHN
jgi:IS5 family transposase